MISIITPFDKPIFIKSSKLKFNLAFKKSYFNLLIYITVTVALMILIAIDKGPTSSFYGITGVILLILTFNNILRVINVRARYFKEVNLMAEKFEKQQFVCTYEFTDLEFNYFDNEKRVYFKWEAFTNYSIKNDCFMLLTNKEILFMLHQTEAGEQQFKQIIELTQSKLSFKKL